MNSNGKEKAKVIHLILITQRLPIPRLSLLSPSIFTMQEDAPPQASSSHMMKTTKRGRPFLKARFSSSLPFPPSPSLTHPGHPRPFRNTYCFPATHNSQAILSLIPQFILHVRTLTLLPPPYSNLSLPYSLSLSLR